MLKDTERMMHDRGKKVRPIFPKLLVFGSNIFFNVVATDWLCRTIIFKCQLTEKGCVSTHLILQLQVMKY